MRVREEKRRDGGERERERDRQTNRQTDRQTDRETEMRFEQSHRMLSDITGDEKKC